MKKKSEKQLLKGVKKEKITNGVAYYFSDKIRMYVYLMSTSLTPEFWEKDYLASVSSSDTLYVALLNNR